MILVALGLALAEMPDDAFEPVTPELVEAQQAWLVYATAASESVWARLLADLDGFEVKADQSFALSAAMVVDRTGKLVEVKLDPPTGNAELDKRFTAAFEAVGEFGVPPEAWIQETGEAVFRIGFTLDAAAMPKGVVRVPAAETP